mgnify:CR=1 FL=1
MIKNFDHFFSNRFFDKKFNQNLFFFRTMILAENLFLFSLKKNFNKKLFLGILLNIFGRKIENSF